jgi:RHS repeat-associated protein
VIANGTTTVEQYGYSTQNGNRTSSLTVSSANVSYDLQDRLTTYGNFTYTYTNNGELKTKTDTTLSVTTTYLYDTAGNLLSVARPSSAPLIEYITDGLNRRVAKKVGGSIAKQWLYRDSLKPVAELDGTGNLVSTFVYASNPNVPDYMVRGSSTYRILTDQIGSVRTVVDVSTGAVAWSASYTAFGVPTITAAQPDFIPFGFAGGLYDVDTGLVRFGARDYDPSVGRWISKDPTRFRGGSNLYTYAWNDPVNLVDRTGRLPTGPRGEGGTSGVSGQGGSEGDDGIPWTPAQPWPLSPVDQCGTDTSGKYVPETDALGSSNLQNACYAHDNCYGTCGSDKSTCDSNLGSDMRRDCSAQGDSCNIASVVYTGFVSALGQSAYNNAQAGCVCGGP